MGAAEVRGRDGLGGEVAVEEDAHGHGGTAARVVAVGYEVDAEVGGDVWAGLVGHGGGFRVKKCEVCDVRGEWGHGYI